MICALCEEKCVFLLRGEKNLERKFNEMYKCIMYSKHKKPSSKNSSVELTILRSILEKSINVSFGGLIYLSSCSFSLSSFASSFLISSCFSFCNPLNQEK